MNTKDEKCAEWSAPLTSAQRNKIEDALCVLAGAGFSKTHIGDAAKALHGAFTELSRTVDPASRTSGTQQ